jgi:hypothetical protein
MLRLASSSTALTLLRYVSMFEEKTRVLTGNGSVDSVGSV